MERMERQRGKLREVGGNGRWGLLGLSSFNWNGAVPKQETQNLSLVPIFILLNQSKRDANNSSNSLIVGDL